jgi:RNA polymerase sigma-70 factor (ECF subfamily)
MDGGNPDGPQTVTDQATGADTRAADDRALVTRFLSGREEAAFRALYRRHAPVLYRFATRLAGGHAAGDDLHQEAWIRAAERLAQFRWESSLRTWLCGIAINCRRETRRARAIEGERSAAGEVEHVPQVPASDDSRLDLERAILALPDGYREVLVLHDLHGYTHEEIARRLEIEAGTSKSQLSRARQAIRRRLGEHREFRKRGGVS